MGQRQTKYFFCDIRFEILQTLAKDQLTEIYLAHDHQTQTKIVIKKIDITPKIYQNITALIKQFVMLNHPNIIKIYNYQSDEITQTSLKIFISMEFAENGQMNKYSGKLTQKQVHTIYTQIKSALQYIQSNQIIHGEIRLKNILLDKQKNAKLNFGTTNKLIRKRIINQYKNFGTNFYESPQLRDLYIMNNKLDLWQLGLVLLQFLTGKTIKQLIQCKNKDGQTIYHHPAINMNFPYDLFLKYNINKEFQLIIGSLLRKDHKTRNFYEANMIKSRDIYLRRQKILKSKIKSQLINADSDQLISLDYSNSQLTDQSAINISQISKLSKLNVSGNNITDKFILYINNQLQSLIQLNLSFNHITDSSLFIISKQCKMLQSLDISYTKITANGIMAVSHMQKLSSVAIWSGIDYYPFRYLNKVRLNFIYKSDHNDKIKINQKCIQQLKKLRLKSLTINQLKSDANSLIKSMDQSTNCIELIGAINQQTIQRIVQLKKLEKIYLKGIKNYKIKNFDSRILNSVGLVDCQILAQDIIQLSTCFIEITNLNLSNNRIGKDGAICIAQKLKNLNILMLGQNSIGDQGAIAISNNIKNLTQLDLTKNNITKQGANAIGRNLKNLIALILTQNNIGKEGCFQIAINLNNLTILDLYNNNIGDQGAIQIAYHLQNLTRLILPWNQIKEEGVIAISDNLKNLILLDLTWNNLNPDVKTLVTKQLKNTTILI